MRRFVYFFSVSVRNILNTPIVSKTIFILIFLSSLLVTAMIELIGDYSREISRVKSRIGADIVVVSQLYEKDMKDSLFLGYPSTFEFESAEVEKAISACKGIKESSNQLYISSLNDSCCEGVVQFVVYNPETDFIISPLLKQYKEQYERRDIIIGSAIDYEVGDKAVFFDCVFCVAGKLEETKMGYDDCIFIDAKVADSIAKFIGMETFDNKASLILINIAQGEDVDAIVAELNREMDSKNLVAYSTGKLFSDISEKVKVLNAISIACISIVVVLLTISLGAFITVSICNKKNEFIYMSLNGISRNWNIVLLAIGQGVLSVIGAICGSALAVILMLLFKGNIENLLGIKIMCDNNLLLCCAREVLIIFLLSVLMVVLISEKVGGSLKNVRS